MTVRANPGASVSLHDWVGAHGALWPPAALVIVLDACARASELTPVELRRSVASLNMVGIVRGNDGGWSWVPAASASAAHRVSDRDIIERLGAILFHGLTGEALASPFAEEQALRTKLRGLRPDLPVHIADLTVGAVSARRRPGVTLAAFARELRQALGVERAPVARVRRTATGVAATAVLAIALGSWWTSAGQRDRLETSGLTRSETTVLDVSMEAAHTFALIDEHTAAIQQHQYLERLWHTRLGPDDPRLAWNEAHEAWVRTLAGDRITTEQLLEDMPSWLAKELGGHHPYTRAARLALAATLDVRGARAQAASLRAQAADDARELLHGPPRETELDDAPVPPGVIAHVTPNAPAREGFRRGADGNYFAPLTSAQRWMAGRDGWRLHVVAAGTCRVSLVAGAGPRLVTVTTSRSPDTRWRIRIEGTRPPAMLDSAALDTVGVSVRTTAAGDLEAKLDDRRVRLTVDPDAPLANPPHSLSFDGGSAGSGCAVVWLEIPFPPEATFLRR